MKILIFCPATNTLLGKEEIVDESISDTLYRKGYPDGCYFHITLINLVDKKPFSRWCKFLITRLFEGSFFPQSNWVEIPDDEVPETLKAMALLLN